MNFNRFLAEALSPLSTDQLLQLKQCTDFLAASGGEPLFRGIKSEEQFIEKTVRQDRKLVDSGGTVMWSMIYNLGMEASFGVKKLRRVSVYATGTPETTYIFGNLYFVFPPNGFKFIGSPTISDSFEDITTSALYRRFKENLKQESVTPSLNSFLEDLQRPMVLNAKLDTVPTISDVVKLYGLNDQEELSLRKALTVTMKHDFEYRDTDLAGLIRRSAEIMVYNIPSYLAVSTEALGNAPLSAYTRLLRDMKK